MEQKYLKIPEELAQRLIEASNVLTIKKETLKAMTAAGVDLTTDSGRAYIQEVADASTEYNKLIYELTKYADENSDYDPLTDTLTFAFTRSAAWWTPTEAVPESKDEPAPAAETKKAAKKTVAKAETAPAEG